MGACAMLPRIVGLGRASSCCTPAARMPGTQALEWGFYNELCEPERARTRAQRDSRATIAHGPTLAHAMTKRMLHEEWAMPLDDAIDAEARAQATLHGERRFPARLRGVRRQARAALRRQLMNACSTGRFSTKSIARSPPACERWLDRRTSLDDERNADASCRAWVRALGDGGWLRACVPGVWRAASRRRRARCASRARRSRTAPRSRDFAFAMQGLGSAPIALFGNADCSARYLPSVATASCIAAFALSEREAGSDVAALATRARRDGDAYVIDGEKTWISNAGIADLYVVFARTGGDGAQGPDARSPWMPRRRAVRRGERDRDDLAASARHAALRSACASRSSRRIGDEGDGFKIAMATLDVFRSTVGAAARRLRAPRARRDRSRTRNRASSSARRSAALQLTQAAIATMATDVDAAALLVYRAAWTKDSGRRARHAARRRWRSGSRPRRRGASATAPCSSSAAAA